MESIIPPFDWEWWVGEFLWFIQALTGYKGGNIDTAMNFLDIVNSITELVDALNEAENVENH